MTRLLPVLLVFVVLATAAMLVYAVLTTPKGDFIQSGLSYAAFDPEHLLGLLAVGIWAGRLGGSAIWALPLSLLAGTILGFPLEDSKPAPALEVFIPALMVILMLPVAAAALLRPPLLLRDRSSAIAAAAALGVCHGYVGDVDGHAARAVLFSLGFIASAAVLLTLGILVGLIGRGDN